MTLAPEASLTLTDRVSELLTPKEIGDVLTYEELRSAGCDIQRSRPVVLKAIKRFLKTRKLACKVIPKVGYQVTHPDEAPRLIGERIRKGYRQIAEGRTIAQNVDTGLMSQQVRQKVTMMEVSLQAVQKEIRSVSSKVAFQGKLLAKHDRAIEKIEGGVLGRLKAEDAAVLERLIEEYRKSKE